MRMDELEAPLTPLQAGARQCILDRAQYAVDVVRQERRAHGAICGRRFELLLDALMKDQGAHALLSANLAPTENAATQAKTDLVNALSRAFRDRTRDELTLGPGIDPETIEDLVDADIEDLFATAYPHQGVPWRELGAHLELSRENSEKMTGSESESQAHEPAEGEQQGEKSSVDLGSVTSSWSHARAGVRQ